MGEAVLPANDGAHHEQPPTAEEYCDQQHYHLRMGGRHRVGRERELERGREGGRKGRREGGREGGKEGGREEGREGGETNSDTQASL